MPFHELRKAQSRMCCHQLGAGPWAAQMDGEGLRKKLDVGISKFYVMCIFSE